MLLPTLLDPVVLPGVLSCESEQRLKITTPDQLLLWSRFEFAHELTITTTLCISTRVFSQETKKTSAKYGEPTTGSLWIAFDRHVCEAGEVGLLHAEFSRKVMADVHDSLFEFYNQKGAWAYAAALFPDAKMLIFLFSEAQRSAVESRANELIRERTQAENAAAKAQESFYKTDKELGFLAVERDTLLRGGSSEKAEKLSAKVEQTKSKLAQLRRDWVRLLHFQFCSPFLRK